MYPSWPSVNKRFGNAHGSHRALPQVEALEARYAPAFMGPVPLSAQNAPAATMGSANPDPAPGNPSSAMAPSGTGAQPSPLVPPPPTAANDSSVVANGSNNIGLTPTTLNTQNNQAFFDYGQRAQLQAQFPNYIFRTNVPSVSDILSARVAQLAAIGSSSPVRSEQTTSNYPSEEDNWPTSEVVDGLGAVLDLGTADGFLSLPALRHFIPATRSRLVNPRSQPAPERLPRNPTLDRSSMSDRALPVIEQRRLGDLAPSIDDASAELES
jgi:hypothetical protein